MSGDNPCNICKSSGNCDGCILNDLSWHSGECYNYDCMLQYECGCLLSLNEVCKASTCFKEPCVWVSDAIPDEEEDDEV